MFQWRHVQTTSHRSQTGRQSADSLGASDRCRAIAGGPGDLAACLGPSDPRRNCRRAGSRACQCAPTPATLPRRSQNGPVSAETLGRPAAGTDELGRGEVVPGTVGGIGPRCRRTGGFALAGSVGRKTGAESQPLGGVPSVGTARVAEGRSRYAASQKRPCHPRRVEKNSRKHWKPL